jgi:methionyl-tRNA formyltransferase
MRVAFMGSPEFAVPCLKALASAHDVALVVSQPDKPAGRGGELRSPAVKIAAQNLGLPVIQPKSARTGELEQSLIDSNIELAVVVAYGKILPRAVLDAPRKGCINVHASLLPKYRGAAPVQWAVIDANEETGVCIMQLDEGMDTGPVWLTKRVAIGAEETSGELLARLSPIGAAALLETIQIIAVGTATPTAQDPTGATHARMLVKSDGAIDFTQEVSLVAARIRGVDPWPGAYAMLKDQPIKLFRPHVTDGTAGRGAGTVLQIDKDGIHVSCHGGVLGIREVQAAGRKRMAAHEFAAGRGIAIGDRLTTPAAEPTPVAESMK